MAHAARAELAAVIPGIAAYRELREKEQGFFQMAKSAFSHNYRHLEGITQEELRIMAQRSRQQAASAVDPTSELAALAKLEAQEMQRMILAGAAGRAAASNTTIGVFRHEQVLVVYRRREEGTYDVLIATATQKAEFDWSKIAKCGAALAVLGGVIGALLGPAGAAAGAALGAKIAVAKGTAALAVGAAGAVVGGGAAGYKAHSQRASTADVASGFLLEQLHTDGLISFGPDNKVLLTAFH